MSFSSDLKTELGTVYDNARHCRAAELAAIVCFSGKTDIGSEGKNKIVISSENDVPIEAAAELIKKLFGFEAPVKSRRSTRNLRSLTLEIGEPESTEVAETLKCREFSEGRFLPDISILTHKNCCKRAFLRGAFIAVGSISNPDKFYHFEIPCRNMYIADNTARIMQKLGLQSKIVSRHKSFVVYIKESDQISEALGLMGARTGLLDLENFRILREMRGNINRRVNCETANINKAAQAAARQIEDILYIEKHMGLSSLPNGLDEMARVRLKYPESTLSELGTYLEPPVGKSGVNHRLRKLSSIAEALRSRGGSYYDQKAGHNTDF